MPGTQRALLGGGEAIDRERRREPGLVSRRARQRGVVGRGQRIGYAIQRFVPIGQAPTDRDGPCPGGEGFAARVDFEDILHQVLRECARAALTIDVGDGLGRGNALPHHVQRHAAVGRRSDR